MSDSPSSYGSSSYGSPSYDSPAQFGAWEKRSGYSTQVLEQSYNPGNYCHLLSIAATCCPQGSYTVALPDGRTQIVTYTVADDDSGYMAEVRELSSHPL